MKRMKKRLLAMLLALMLVVGLLPVGVLAAGTAEVIGGQYEGDLTVEYRIEISQLYKLIMLNADDVNDDTKLEGATIHFHEGKGYGDSQNLLPNTAVDKANFYYYYSFSNVSDAGDPYNISGLTIKYDGKEVYINASDLRIRYDGSQTYFVESRNDEKNIVIFYDNGEATSVTKGDYWVYAVRLIDKRATVTNWPDEPGTITYPFINWTYNPDGTGGVFLSNSKVNNDTEVFARKVSGDDTTAGILIHVMNDNNALLERFVELYNAKYSDSITTADINDAVLDSMKITVRGSDGSSTNPNYYVSALEHNGWEDGYYKIYNRDGDSLNPSSQLYNKHIPIGEISSITIEAKIGENTINVDISRGSNPGDFEAATSALDRIIILTINAPPEKPSNDDLDVDPDVPGDTGLLAGAVTVTCTNTDVKHDAQTFDLLPDSFSIGDVVYTTEGYTCTVTVNAGAYVTAYSNSTENGTHALAEDESSTKTIKLVYHGNSWTVPEGATPVNFNVTCDSGTPDPDPEKPRDPNDTELRKLAVVLDCVNEDVDHMGDPKTFNLETTNCTYAIKQVNGQYFCTVTPNYDLILERYNDQVTDGHTYVNDDERKLLLSWNHETKAWDVAGGPSITRQVKCETPEQPDGYKIYVTVHNGTATFCDIEVTSYILAAENEDITITFTPDEGYTLDYATIDGDMLQIPDGGVYTLKLVDSDHTIEVFYAEDKLGGGDDGDEPDDTPDYRQVFVKYVAADGNGSVAPSFDTFNLEVDENGKVMTNDALSLKGKATPNADATFAYWTIDGLGYDGGAYSYEADLSGKGFTGYVAGETYTFTAYFNGPVVKPEQPTDDELKALLNGKITVECVNDDAEHGDNTKTYGFLKNGIALNAVNQDEDGTSWTTDITIIGAVYSQQYSEDVGDAHKLTSDDKYPTIQLKWVPSQGSTGGSWTLNDTDATVTFEVTCDVKTVTTPGGTIVIEKDPEDPTDPDQTGVSDLLETDDHIQYLFGYPDDSFGPDRNMTRAEAAQMFYNLLKNKNVDAEPAFDDVPEGAWYATPVNVMAELGIVDGVGDDKFEPNREITRAEFTTMAMRFAKVPSGGVNIFTDVAPSDWFYSYVVNSIQYGWIEGYGDGTFRPDRLITRAEVTTIVNRMLDRQADMAFVIQNRDKLTKFTDLTTEHWAYYTIVEATNEHKYKKPAIGEDWTSLKK